MVNILIRIKDEKSGHKLKVMVGISFSPTDAKAPVYDYSMGMLVARLSSCLFLFYFVLFDFAFE
jgi:hypothetical protein